MNSEEEKKQTEEVKKDEADKAIEAVEKVINTKDFTSSFSKEDVSTNKGSAVMCYILCLFLYPLLKNKKSKYVNFHINQGLNLFIAETIVYIFTRIMISLFTVRSLTSYVPGWVSLINYILLCIVFILAILGIINVSNNKSKELPLIGKYRFIKYIEQNPPVQETSKTEIIEIKEEEKNS